MTDVTEMTRDEFDQYMNDNNITEEHEEYSNIFAAYLFGGENPNELIENITSKYRVSTQEPSQQKEAFVSEWELRDGSAE